MPETPSLRPTHAKIDLRSLSYNFHSIRDFVGRNVLYMAVVKANAYGHGAIECARRLQRDGADWFATATLEEAVELRRAGISKPILCLGGFYQGQEETGLSLDITPAVFTFDAADRLNRIALNKGLKLPVHLKIDTGMGRVGIPFRDVREFADRLVSLTNLDIQAVMTHFAVADNLSERKFTNEQIVRFYAAMDLLREKGFRPTVLDMANSPAAVTVPSSRADMVRIGGILFGLGRDVLPEKAPKPKLRPVLSLHSAIAQIKRVPAGTSIGYGRTFVTTRESVIGTVPIGYHDGYPRSLSNRGSAIVNDRLVPIAGRVSMDWTTLDLTGLPGADVGDEVTLIGTRGEHSILTEDLAAHADTISYEITCGFSQRVRREYSEIPEGEPPV